MSRFFACDSTLNKGILKQISDIVTLWVFFVIGTSHLLIGGWGGGSVIFFTEGEVLNLTSPPPATHTKQVEKLLTPSDKTF